MNREKKGNRHDGEKAFRSGRGKLLALVAVLTLSVGLVGGYLIAKETETSGEKLPASKPATERGLPQLRITQKEASAGPAPQLEAIYAQLNCMCGSCDRTLAACDDQTATTMKAEVAAAFRDHKSEQEIIDQMVKQYGAKVLRTAGSSAQQAPAQNSTPSTAAEGLPAFAYNSAQSLEAYRIATQIPEVLEKMPCYCGCGNQSKHRYLKDCFLKDGGSGFDAHASRCNVCDSEAIDVKKWSDEKIPLKEIRAKIDEKYHKYGVPTPTPPIG